MDMGKRRSVMRKITAHLLLVSVLLMSVGLKAVSAEKKEYKLLDIETFMEMETVGSPNISIFVMLEISLKWVVRRASCPPAA